MRYELAALITAMGWILWPTGGAACELPAVDSERPPALIRKPVLSDHVRFVSGFGMRRHPLLGQLRMHTGIDWAASIGTPVVSSGDGRVVSVAVHGEYGNTIVLDHGAGWQTLYGHLSKTEVVSGDCLSRGAVIGKLGATGLASGPTLHFEVQRWQQPIDPLSLSTQ